MLDLGKPILGFAAHLANWELPAIVAKVLVEHSAVLYRRPNSGCITDGGEALRLEALQLRGGFL